eukprot:TRINITY_DN39699_c0_g1_i1.p1 TRINITY_DN39699_c0_g1~~TRINITY_DN39699_c0_g1_i1.p1  ORF type:complete len:258 (-),score=7.60 TRINITY_DN39699_c0_g1_i1:382-1155(-)
MNPVLCPGVVQFHLSRSRTFSSHQNSMAPAMKSTFVCSDNELMVDMVIAASQKKKREALASFGRDLVPYFVPGATDLTEDAVNVNTDVDALRRSGGDILDIPEPVASTQLVQKPQLLMKKSPKKAARNSRKHSPGQTTTLRSSPPAYVQADYRKPSASFFAPEAWAGPTYVNSPPPSSLPVPSFLKSKLKPDLNQVACIGSTTESSSPMNTITSLASEPSAAIYCITATVPVPEQFNSHPLNPVVIEGNLKRLLQVA